jgi:hypothetical protein
MDVLPSSDGVMSLTSQVTPRSASGPTTTLVGMPAFSGARTSSRSMPVLLSSAATSAELSSSSRRDAPLRYPDRPPLHAGSIAQDKAVIRDHLNVTIDSERQTRQRYSRRDLALVHKPRVDKRGLASQRDAARQFRIETDLRPAIIGGGGPPARKMPGVISGLDARHVKPLWRPALRPVERPHRLLALGGPHPGRTRRRRPPAPSSTFGTSLITAESRSSCDLEKTCRRMADGSSRMNV